MSIRTTTSPVSVLLVSVALTGVLPQGCGSVGRVDAAALKGSRPNVIFIFSDDHAPHAISAYGSKINATPNIDRLANEGMLFRHCFCANSICGPSRATVLTGKHSHANGFMRNGNQFDPTQTTFPKLLQGVGYQTAMIGKWHLGTDPVGFDHWIVLPGQGQYYNPDFLTPDGRKRIPGYCTDVTTDLALDWLEEQRDPDRPFVLMCQHKAPHRSWMPGPEELGLYRDAEIPEPATLFDDYRGRGPAAALQEMEIDRHMYMFYDLKLVPTEAEQTALKGPDRWWSGVLDRMTPGQRSAWDAAYEGENRAFRDVDPKGDALVRWKYQRYIKNYLRCVAGVDKSVGQILDWLDANPKVAANTVVIYSSDQGFYLGDHGWYDKRWMYEESLRMPFLVRWPGKIAAGQSTAALAQNIDFAPTFLELAGARVPDEVHGCSLVPVLAGEEPDDWRDAIYYHYYESHAVHMVAAHYGVRTGRYKLLHFYEPEHRCFELYDLETDPDELTNVYQDPAYAEVREKLRVRLAELRAECGDDTGRVGDGEFDITAGVAFVERRGDGWRIRSNSRGTYVLKTCEPIAGTVRLASSARAVEAGRPGRGMLVVAGKDPRSGQFRGGVDFAGGKLVILGPDLKELAAAEISVPSGAVPIEVEVDLAAHTMTARGGGQSVTARVPATWNAVTAYGYGLSNSTAEFGAIEATR